MEDGPIIGTSMVRVWHYRMIELPAHQEGEK
jgi:hypothetical protein